MTWADGYEKYSGSVEVRRHRRKNTFGGERWRTARTKHEFTDSQIEIALKAREIEHGDDARSVLA